MVKDQVVLALEMVLEDKTTKNQHVNVSFYMLICLKPMAEGAKHDNKKNINK